MRGGPEALYAACMFGYWLFFLMFSIFQKWTVYNLFITIGYSLSILLKCYKPCIFGHSPIL